MSRLSQTQPRTLTLTLGLLAMLAACAEVDMPEPPEGQQLFVENCAICHGPGGRGNGELAPALRPRPPDLTTIAARNGGLLPRDMVLSAIDGYAKGSQAEEMPEFGLLLRGPTVPLDVGDGRFTPVPRPLAALVAYLENIQR